MPYQFAGGGQVRARPLLRPFVNYFADTASTGGAPADPNAVPPGAVPGGSGGTGLGDPLWNVPRPDAVNQGIDYHAMGLGPVANYWRSHGGAPGATLFWNAASPEFRSQYGDMYTALLAALQGSPNALPPGPQVP